MRVHVVHCPCSMMSPCTLLPSQENIRRLLSSNDASSEFNTWCEQELEKFNTDVDGTCILSFLSGTSECYCS